jgi:hypothetical protein
MPAASDQRAIDKAMYLIIYSPLSNYNSDKLLFDAAIFNKTAKYGGTMIAAIF